MTHQPFQDFFNDQTMNPACHHSPICKTDMFMISY
jgi:hypothetical protein